MSDLTVFPGSVFDVEIAGVGSKGDGFALLGTLIVFVRSVKIGDRVRIRITRVFPTYSFGEVVESEN